ncbi:MAG: hypothetical protein COB02_02335 [Candidatus Cloacimonadota bacterium]|nr:MAG: hypothetical protein COB02_02335 [Candidatus Cloacimonadota bacterium]
MFINNIGAMNNLIIKQKKLPTTVIYLTIFICLLPTCLNFLGFDFSSHIQQIETNLLQLPKSELIDALFYRLRGAFTHTLLEWSSVSIAIFSYLLALVQFSLKKDSATPIIGLALFCSGCVDAFHTLAASRLIESVAENSNLIPFTWAISRVFNITILIIGSYLILYKKQSKSIKNDYSFMLKSSAILLLLSYIIIHICANSSSLPQTMYPDSFITRPWDVFPLLLTLFAAIFIYPKLYKIHPDYFTHALFISVIPELAIELHMAFGSTNLFDNHFNIAHFLKIVAYTIPLIGLIYDYIDTYLDEIKHQKDLIKANETAKQSVIAKSQFLATMSHEIRTPMNGVLGMSGLLAQTNLSSTQLNYTNIIRSSGESLLRIINDILDFSKAEQNQLEIENIKFNLKTCLEETIEILFYEAWKKKVYLVLHYDSELKSQFIGDSLRLKQVIINLISNAIKFTPQGNIIVYVKKVKQENEMSTIQFSVKDDGIGIPTNKLASIFNRFTQADTSTTRKFGGTGLGLSISQKIIKLMGGEIKVKSKEGQGSNFYFNLSLANLEAPQQDSLYSNLSGLKLLIVDDNFINREVLIEQFKKYQINVKAVESGKAALIEIDLANKNKAPYDFGILDYKMPQMDGIQLAESIYKSKENKDFLSILVSVEPLDQNIEVLHQIGIHSFIKRPYKINLLLELINNIFAQKKCSTGILLNESKIVLKNKPSQFDPIVRALVVDDNQVNQIVAIQMIKNLGLKVIDKASNGLEAVKMQKEFNYDIIFMDCQMPELDGFEATQQIRKLSNEKSKVPIIAMTANVLHEEQEKCIKSGMNQFLSKPVKQSDFEVIFLELFETID